MFQTNPCGVEACARRDTLAIGAGFRRTLVGLKQPDQQVETRYPASFRRTLVGLKPSGRETGVTPVCEFQTNPCGVEASSYESIRWTVHEGFRRTLVGLKRYCEIAPVGTERVSDEPLWG